MKPDDQNPMVNEAAVAAPEDSGLGAAIRIALRDRRFIIAGLILLVSAVGLQATASWMQVYFRKLPVPLRKPLQNLNLDKLYPYRLVKTVTLTSEMESKLGTKDYIQMQIEDPEVRSDDGFGRYLSLFVTYYTGDPDQVPHVPDVCYLGGGYDPAGTADQKLKLPGLGLPDDELPIRILNFKDPRSLGQGVQTVVYFFSVNGRFAAKRDDVRWHLASLRLKYAYFSKVELSFTGRDVPDTAKVTEVAGRFLSKVLPILMREHWADWERYGH